MASTYPVAAIGALRPNADEPTMNLRSLIIFEGVRCQCGETRTPPVPVNRDFIDYFEATCPNCKQVGENIWRELTIEENAALLLGQRN